MRKQFKIINRHRRCSNKKEPNLKLNGTVTVNKIILGTILYWVFPATSNRFPLISSHSISLHPPMFGYCSFSRSESAIVSSVQLSHVLSLNAVENGNTQSFCGSDQIIPVPRSELDLVFCPLSSS